MVSVKKIALVIDDSNITRATVSGYLGINGFECDIAEDGISALKKLAEKSYGIIFSDIEMPNMNGLEFLKRIKSNFAYKNIPIVMLTSLNDQVTVTKIKNLGGNCYMMKPYNRDKMTNALRECGF